MNSLNPLAITKRIPSLFSQTFPPFWHFIGEFVFVKKGDVGSCFLEFAPLGSPFRMQTISETY